MPCGQANTATLKPNISPYCLPSQANPCLLHITLAIVDHYTKVPNSITLLCSIRQLQTWKVTIEESVCNEACEFCCKFVVPVMVDVGIDTKGLEV